MNAFAAGHRIPQVLRSAPAQPRTLEQRQAVLREVSRSFVGLFMGQLLKSMRSTVKPGALGHGGSAEQQFQRLADDEMAMEAAQSEAYGLSELVYQSLLAKTRSGLPHRPVTKTEGESSSGQLSGRETLALNPVSEQGESHE